MIEVNEMISSKSYKSLCDSTFQPGSTEPMPSGIVNVPMEHVEEFLEVSGNTDNQYIVVGQRSDFGLYYQSEHQVGHDMRKWVAMIPHMGKEVCDFDEMGYKELGIPARCDTNKCNINDRYSVKCDSFTRVTFPVIPPNIHKWFTVNCMVTEPRVQGMPFGFLDSSMAEKIAATPSLDKQHLLYVNFQTYTLSRFYLKRYFQGIANKDWLYFLPEPKSVEEYLFDISASKFVLCPNGNGVDCFRTWETLYLGSIPIVQNSRAAQYFSDLPILIVDDFYSLTPDFLQEKHAEITSKEWNLDKLKLSYWKSLFEKAKNESCN